MSLKNRLNKLEKAHAINTTPSNSALFFWSLHRQNHPEAPEIPPDDYVQFYQGKTFEDLLAEVHRLDCQS